MPCIPVVNYLKNAKGLPFFYSVGDENYLDVLSDLKHLGLSVIRVSDFCKKEDKFPDLDDLIDSFRTGDVDYRDNRFVVIGLGEYLALSGPEEIVTELGRLKNTTLGNARVPQYGTVTRKGVLYYRTRILDADGKQVSLYGTTCEELYDKEQEARRQVAEIIFHREHPTVAEYCEKWLLMQSAKVSPATKRCRKTR